MTTYKETRGTEGVIANDAHVPADPANRDWAEKTLVESQGGFSPDAAPTLPIADARAAAIAQVEGEADRRRAYWMPKGVTAQSLLVLQLMEAEKCLADGTPTAGEYPLLAALIDEVGIDVSAVATAIVAQVGQIKSEWVPIEETRSGAVFDLNSAANQDEIDAILAAISWPALGS